jgi:hypothetical protein
MPLLKNLMKDLKLVSQTSSRALNNISSAYVAILAISSISHILLIDRSHELLFLFARWVGLVLGADKYNSSWCQNVIISS